jgi:hypothetical protein
MPKVTLLGKDGATYHYPTPKRIFDFESGVPQEVPVATALALGKKKGLKGKPLFLIEELPEIVQPATPEQNVDSAQLHQPRFIEPWPSTQQ